MIMKRKLQRKRTNNTSNINSEGEAKKQRKNTNNDKKRWRLFPLFNYLSIFLLHQPMTFPRRRQMNMFEGGIMCLGARGLRGKCPESEYKFRIMESLGRQKIIVSHRERIIKCVGRWQSWRRKKEIVTGTKLEKNCKCLEGKYQRIEKNQNYIRKNNIFLNLQKDKFKNISSEIEKRQEKIIGLKRGKLETKVKMFVTGERVKYLEWEKIESVTKKMYLKWESLLY